MKDKEVSTTDDQEFTDSMSQAFSSLNTDEIEAISASSYFSTIEKSEWNRNHPYSFSNEKEKSTFPLKESKHSTISTFKVDKSTNDIIENTLEHMSTDPVGKQSLSTIEDDVLSSTSKLIFNKKSATSTISFFGKGNFLMNYLNY